MLKKLENFSDSMVGSELPAIGTFLSSTYDLGENQTMPLMWQVLGYNGSIPQYIKYKNSEGKRIYVSSIKNNLLSVITQGDAIYEKTSEGQYVVCEKTIGAVGLETFTYGQTNETWGTTATESGSYSVPMSIVVDNITYTFCGYTLSLAAQGTLGVLKDSYYYTNADFFAPVDYYTNAWGDSLLRAWFNGYNVDLSEQKWRVYDGGDVIAQTYGNTIPTFITRFSSDKKFFKSVIPVVNRTWVWGTNSWNILWNQKHLDANKCEHTVDKFWLLSLGQLNFSDGTYIKDYLYDTAIFSGVFEHTEISTGSQTRTRYLLNTEGNPTVYSRYWRIRSASPQTSNQGASAWVCYITPDGQYGSYTVTNTFDGNILPACTFG